MRKTKTLYHLRSKPLPMQEGLLITVLFIVITGLMAPLAQAKAESLQFTHTFSGKPLEIVPTGKEEVTLAVKAMLSEGRNLYLGNEDIIEDAEALFLRHCAICHGIGAKGRMGPNLTDTTWVYAKNKTDKGFFESVYGGTGGMMKGFKGGISLDEILQVMAYVRSLSE